MLRNDNELKVTLARIAWFQEQIGKLRVVETNQANFDASVGGFIAELDRMHLQVREYLRTFPQQPAPAAGD